MEVELVFKIVFIVLAAVILTAASFKMFHIFQLSGYKTKGVINWLKATKLDYIARYFSVAFLAFITMFVFLGCFGLYEWAYYLGSLLFFLFGGLFVFVALKSEKKNKTPLKLTKRIWRLAVLTAILNAGLIAGLLILGKKLPMIQYSLTSLAFFLIPLVVMLAHCIILPVEKLIRSSIKRQAAKKIAEFPDLIKIGITGSFGKTTAKNILAQMLSKKYKVCVTPANFNTPMGIAKTVFSSDFGADTEVFIAEMGARSKGDIAELCNMVKPQIGMITAIGCQHLETFGSLETIKNTKYELIEGLPASGRAFFGDGNEGARELFERCRIQKTIAGEIVSFSQVRTTEKGTEFILSVNGERVSVSTELLGKHIPGLIALCGSVAVSLGITLSEIAEAVGALEPVPHRLQLLKPSSGMTVIDNAYNSNPEGAANALEILSQFEGTRIVVTPGMVELGEREPEANAEFGRKIASAADYAVFNSSRSVYLKKGAIGGGMDESRIFIVESLAAATEKIKEIPGDKKVILFENDLPDNLL